MSRPFTLEISESAELLKKHLHHARTASQKEKLLLLWWLKCGQVEQQQELAERLGRDTSTITRWLQKYRRGGIGALLEEKKSPGKAWEIDGEMLSQLESKLAQPEGFGSYGAIVQWLEQTFGKVVNYQTVYKTVRYRLQAKLKVPRPRSLKQDEQAVGMFKKTFL